MGPGSHGALPNTSPREKTRLLPGMRAMEHNAGQPQGRTSTRTWAPPGHRVGE
ncbi:hypothetical protein D187_003534 [Cystobacter fuscus DSM 2262]|uniref:Uncharacterized protein n=1 Tax=Cystobacter fuscus (strain ATCC 25194 / DSM 2262 / NBRC 100088 / M29) TaxID=1242864 RepID=S9QBW6_CYSF2|nr:hypothetical protein D187_003534 [Cystobacter fuscus DSM 2262]